jgi:hypothetical protein
MNGIYIYRIKNGMFTPLCVEFQFVNANFQYTLTTSVQKLGLSVSHGISIASMQCVYSIIRVNGATCFHAGILLSLLDPEDGGDMFLRKFG